MPEFQKYSGVIPAFYACYDEEGAISPERVRALTHDSPRNHSYARRPVHAHPDFYAFWADGDPDNMSISRLYFCNERGDLFRMSYTMQSEWQKPEPIPGGRPRD